MPGAERSRAGTPLAGNTVLELTGRRKDGQQFSLELTLPSCQGRGHTFFTGIMRDVTERFRPEEALRRSEEQLPTRRRWRRLAAWLAGHSGNALAHRGVLDPGMTLMEKPFALYALARRVREVLDRRGPLERGERS